MIREIAWLKRDCHNYGEKELTRLKKGEPIDYIIGWRDFLGCRIDLSSKPLIPRIETEFWVEQVIKEMEARPPRALVCLDLFAGSGCIGQAVLKHCPNVQMTFGDLYSLPSLPPDLKRARGLAGVVRTNIFSNITGKFDVIFANPPYIPTRKSCVQKSVKNWEPKKALFAGPDGLIIIKKFLKQAQNYLKPDGLIYLEFGYGQKLAIIKLLKKYNYKSWQFNKDQFGKWRWVVIK